VTLTGVVVGVVGALSVEPLLGLLRVPTAALEDTRIYMRIIFAAIPFMFFFFVLQGVLQGVGDSVTALKIQFVTVTLNAVLDPLLIFGVGPIPALGVAGAATATLVSRVLSAVAILVILFRGKEGLRIHARDLWPRDGAWRKLIDIGVPLATGQGIAALGFTVLQGVVNGFGVAVIAAFGVGNRIIGLFNMPALGLSRGTAALVGQELGAGREAGAKKVVRLSIVAMLTFIVPAMVFTFFFGNEVMRFFVDDPEVIAQGAILFRVVSVSVIPFTLFTVINGAFQGGGVTRPVMVLSILRLWGIRVPLAMFLAWNLALGPVGIWYSMFVSNILTATLGFLLLRRGSWLKRLDLDMAGSVA
jgi:putative MATE family efflux protein